MPVDYSGRILQTLRIKPNGEEFKPQVERKSVPHTHTPTGAQRVFFP
jgi:hypothetical protein